MTDEERRKMMEEIMQVVDKHVSMSEGKESGNNNNNRYGREFGISDDTMTKWKKEYKKMRVEGKKILDEVRNHPINVMPMKFGPSFDLETQEKLL